MRTSRVGTITTRRPLVAVIVHANVCSRSRNPTSIPTQIAFATAPLATPSPSFTTSPSTGPTASAPTLPFFPISLCINQAHP
jgi:hypothetical protein